MEMMGGGGGGGGPGGLPHSQLCSLLAELRRGDDQSSVGGDSAGRFSVWRKPCDLLSQRVEITASIRLGYFVGDPGGSYYSNDVRSQGQRKF
jgi:hypothetical protein